MNWWPVQAVPLPLAWRELREAPDRAYVTMNSEKQVKITEGRVDKLYAAHGRLVTYPWCTGFHWLTAGIGSLNKTDVGAWMDLCKVNFINSFCYELVLSQ